VKKVKQIGQFLQSIALSGCILLILNGSIAAGDDTFIIADSHQFGHTSLVAADLLSITTDAEQYFEENIQRLLSAPSKQSFGDYLAVARITESYRSHLLKKCIAYTRHNVPRFDKQDIVFPFHYFW
jgi:hypothetical protein